MKCVPGLLERTWVQAQAGAYVDDGSANLKPGVTEAEDNDVGLNAWWLAKYWPVALRGVKERGQ